MAKPFVDLADVPTERAAHGARFDAKIARVSGRGRLRGVDAPPRSRYLRRGRVVDYREGED